jgi:hypothetical protein
MHRRHLLVSLGLVVIVAAAVTLAASAGGSAVSVSAGVHWSIPLPNQFDVALGNNLEFNASKDENGNVSGHFRYVQTDDGVPYEYAGTITCLQAYGSRVKLGGLIESSTDSTVPAGSYGWFQEFDNGEGANAAPDRSTLMGVGDEAANEAFCASPNLPRFGPWDVQGNIQVRN